jgi:CO/xanthine dehydrogenase Mo-binding subunit
MAQGPYSSRQAIADALGLPPTSVRVEVFRAAGNYGHNIYDDVSIAAALLSQAVGKPVRVQFMRWDEHGWDQFGPAQATDVRAGVGANGKIVRTTTRRSITDGRRSSRAPPNWQERRYPRSPRRGGSTRSTPVPSTRSRTAA